MSCKFSSKLRRPLGNLLFLFSVAFMPAACQSTDPQMTTTAVYAEAHSTLESLRSTATVARARMQTTLDHAVTRVAKAEEAGRFLRSNLISLGTDTGFIDDSLREIEALATPSPRTVAERGAFIGCRRPGLADSHTDYNRNAASRSNFRANYRRWTAPGRRRYGDRRRQQRLRN